MASEVGERRRLRLPRRIALFWLRAVGSLSLSQRFLVVAVTVVALAMAGLGAWGGYYVQRGITEGVANTAAASIDALVAHEVGQLRLTGELSADVRANLDDVFAIGNDAESTRLLQIRIRDLDRRLAYESSAALEDPHEDEDEMFAAATAGRVSSRLIQVAVPPVGPFEGLPLEVLEITTPLRVASTGEIFAVAELYYSARSVLAQRDRAQLDVWLLVGIFGVLVIAALYLVVDRASRTITRQRTVLAENLAASRRLSEENHALHATSEELRRNANFANEALLNQVGSDIHDGPIQVLTLIILRLSDTVPPTPATTQALQLATDVLEELRNISSGLVLPELAPMTLGKAIDLAITRHQNLTGTRVTRRIGELPDQAQLVLKICLYRVVQEALMNAYRHGSGAGNIVTAECDGDTIRVTVSNPPGRSPRGDSGRLGMGLRGMRFRVESLGGNLEIEVKPGAPSVVRASVPVSG
ncbi:MAG TPA: ATP-binding protein [Devosia sp.]